MMHSIHFGASKPPALIRIFLILTGVISIFSALADVLFLQALNTSGPQIFLALSWSGITQGYIWQPISYLFVQNAPSGITPAFLFDLAFSLYLLWTLGSFIQSSFGSVHFLVLYLAGGALSGICGVFMGAFFGSYAAFSGPAGSLLILFLLFTMIDPEHELYLFLTIPVKLKRLFAFTLGALVLINLSHWSFGWLFLYFFSLIFGYLYGVLFLGLCAPFACFHPLDNLLLKLKNKFFKKHDSNRSGKIFSIKTGKPLMNDDAFVDAMLAKIAKEGEKSMTSKEKKRLDEIAKNKNTSKSK